MVEASWYEFSINVSYEYVEPVAALFSCYCTSGVVIEENGIFNPDEGEIRPSRANATVRAYIPTTARYQTRRELVHIGIELISQLGHLPAMLERTVTARDWEAAWKSHFPVLHIGNQLVVSAPFHEYAPSGNEIVIQVDPGLAFGTGHHPTTYRCLEVLERVLAPGCRVMDVGAGSGILAIAAAKLGAGDVIAVEVDRIALRVSRKNIRINGVQHIVRCYLGTVPHEHLRPRTGDLVLANLNAVILTDRASALRDVVGPRGLLIASGILADHHMQVQQAFRDAKLNIRESIIDGDWVTIIANPL